MSKCIIKWIMLQLPKPTKAYCLNGELLKFHPNTWLHDTLLLWPAGQMTSGLERVWMHIYSRKHNDVWRATKIILVNNMNYTKASLYGSELF